MHRSKAVLFGFCIVFILALPSLAFGYIDPGTGSYIIQIIIGLVVGGGIAIKVFWQKIKTFFGSIFRKKQK